MDSSASRAAGLCAKEREAIGQLGHEGRKEADHCHESSRQQPSQDSKTRSSDAAGRNLVSEKVREIPEKSRPQSCAGGSCAGEGRLPSCGRRTCLPDTRNFLPKSTARASLCSQRGRLGCRSRTIGARQSRIRHVVVASGFCRWPDGDCLLSFCHPARTAPVVALVVAAVRRASQPKEKAS